MYNFNINKTFSIVSGLFLISSLGLIGCESKPVNNLENVKIKGSVYKDSYSDKSNSVIMYNTRGYSFLFSNICDFDLNKGFLELTLYSEESVIDNSFYIISNRFDIMSFDGDDKVANYNMAYKMSTVLVGEENVYDFDKLISDESFDMADNSSRYSGICMFENNIIIYPCDSFSYDYSVLTVDDFTQIISDKYEWIFVEGNQKINSHSLAMKFVDVISNDDTLIYEVKDAKEIVELNSSTLEPNGSYLK